MRKKRSFTLCPHNSYIVRGRGIFEAVWFGCTRVVWKKGSMFLKDFVIDFIKRVLGIVSVIRIKWEDLQIVSG